MTEALKPSAADDAIFARQVEHMLKAIKAIDEWEKVHGRQRGKVLVISCPNCATENRLKFARSQHHLYLECETPECMPPARANCRGQR